MIEKEEDFFEFKDNDVEKCDYNFKCVLIGDTGVGKSCLLKRLIEDDKMDIDIFCNNNNNGTIGVDYKRKMFNLERSNVKVGLNIYDTSGSEQFKEITFSYLVNVQAFLIIYDVTSMKSFSNCQYWMDEIHKRNSSQVIKILVGCKNDTGSETRPQVPAKKAREFAKKNGFLLFYETSAKDNLNIKILFDDLCMELISNYIKFLNFQQSTFDLVSTPCTSKSYMLDDNSMSIAALSSKSDVFFNCKSESLNCNHIILNSTNSKRKNLQQTKLSIFDFF